MLNILKIATVTIAVIAGAGSAYAGDNGQNYPDTLIHLEEMSSTGSF